LDVIGRNFKNILIVMLFLETIVNVLVRDDQVTTVFNVSALILGIVVLIISKRQKNKVQKTVTNSFWHSLFVLYWLKPNKPIAKPIKRNFISN